MLVAYEEHMWEARERLVQSNLHFFCNTLYRVDADEVFVGAMHLIHYPRAASEIVENESIQKGHDRTCCSSELWVNWDQQQGPCMVKCTLLPPAFHTAQQCYRSSLSPSARASRRAHGYVRTLFPPPLAQLNRSHAQICHFTAIVWENIPDPCLQFIFHRYRGCPARPL